MISKIFKSTLKTIIRSPLTWGGIVLLFGASIYYSLIISNGKVDLNTFELIYDTDPRFVLSYQLYIQRVLNTLIGGSLMRFSAPSFCVIISGIITTRDWKDNLYEIERAGGVSPTKYFVGKFSSVLFFFICE